MLGSWLAGLLMVSIGVYDAYVGHYAENQFISSKYPTIRRYLFPAVWVIMGIVFIVSGFYA